MKLQDLLRHLYYEPSLITPEAHASIRDLLDFHLERTAEGVCGESVEVPQAQLIDGIMHIPIGGAVGYNLKPFQRGNGCVDLLDIISEIDEAESNPECRGVLFDFDSPGGMLYGTPECADRILAMTKEKFAYTAAQIFSAAYWLASSCDGIFGTRSSIVGSVGVFMPIIDSSAAMAAKGLTVELIKVGKYKGIGIPGTSLKAGDRAYLQGKVNSIYSMFTSHLEKTRPDIQAADLEGQTYFGEDAVSRGFLDAVVRTKQEVLDLFS